MKSSVAIAQLKCLVRSAIRSTLLSFLALVSYLYLILRRVLCGALEIVNGQLAECCFSLFMACWCTFCWHACLVGLELLILKIGM